MNMRHTDKFFIFPIKCYNENYNEDPDATDAEWILGYARLPLAECYEITWHDTFTAGKDLAELAKKGGDLTKIVSERYGTYISLWDRKKFEKKIDEYMEKIEGEVIIQLSVDGQQQD